MDMPGEYDTVGLEANLFIAKINKAIVINVSVTHTISKPFKDPWLLPHVPPEYIGNTLNFIFSDYFKYLYVEVNYSSCI